MSTFYNLCLTVVIVLLILESRMNGYGERVGTIYRTDRLCHCLCGKITSSRTILDVESGTLNSNDIGVTKNYMLQFDI